MKNKYFNAVGDELKLGFNGTIYVAEGLNNIEYVSQHKFGAIAAFEESIDEDDEIFYSRHDGVNYKAKLSAELTKKSEGKKIFLVKISTDYLV
tara:strand:- start:70650 stop:70928 length:279 start_codon:yes stop_codon:yes gene_type:complete